MPGAIRTLPAMSETSIGYARCSTGAQDLTAQRDRLRELGVAEERICPDHGLTGTKEPRGYLLGLRSVSRFVFQVMMT